MPFGHLTRSRLAVILGTAAVVVVLLWIAARYQQRNEALRQADIALDVLSINEDSDLDVPALRLLMEAPYPTRRAALELLLSSDRQLPRLQRHLQGFTVALSQIRAGQAADLAHSLLLPAFAASTNPETLQGAAELFHRWSIAAALSPADADDLINQLKQKIIADASPERLEAYARAVEDLTAAGVSWETEVTPGEDPLDPSDPFLERLLGETDPEALRWLLDAGRANYASDEGAGAAAAAGSAAFSSVLDQRFSEEEDPDVLRVLADAMGQLPEQATPSQPASANPAISAATTPFDADFEQLNTLLDGLRWAAPALPAKEARALANQITGRMQSEQDRRMLSFQATALSYLGDAVPPEAAQTAREVLLPRVLKDPDVSAAATAAVNLSGLPPDSDTSNRAMAALVRRILNERDPYAVSMLATGMTALAPTASDARKAELAAQMAAPILRETDLPIQARLAVAFHTIADALPPAEANAFATRVLDRMQRTAGAASLRLFSFLLDPVRDTIDASLVTRARAILLDQALATASSERLTEISMGMYLLSRGAVFDAEPQAGTLLTHLGEAAAAETDLGHQGELVHSMALLGLTVPESVATAASAPEATHLLADLRREREPLRLRFLGNLLAMLPGTRLTSTDLAALDHMFEIPDAPCQVAMLTDNLTDAARQVANPACSETSWTRLASMLLDQPMEDPLEEPTLDEMAGVGDDDGAADEEGEEPPTIDFLALSQAMDELLPDRP